MKMFVAAVMLVISNAHAAELPVRPPQPGGLFADEPTTERPQAIGPNRGSCPAGQFQTWINRHDQGAITFSGYDALWEVGEQSKRYMTAGGGTGVPIRIAVDDDPDTMPLAYFVARTRWALSSGGSEEAEAHLERPRVLSGVPAGTANCDRMKGPNQACHGEFSEQRADIRAQSISSAAQGRLD
jgi:hypothetical protein